MQAPARSAVCCWARLSSVHSLCSVCPAFQPPGTALNCSCCSGKCPFCLVNFTAWLHISFLKLSFLKLLSHVRRESGVAVRLPGLHLTPSARGGRYPNPEEKVAPDLSPGGVSLWKEVSVLGTPQQVLPSAGSGGDAALLRAVQEQIHALDPCLSPSPLSF